MAEGEAASLLAKEGGASIALIAVTRALLLRSIRKTRRDPYLMTSRSGSSVSTYADG
jgi:hypothetical protein